MDKIPVLNPLTLRNNVGQELIDIAEANGYGNIGELIGVKNLEDKERLNAISIGKTAKELGLPLLEQYLANFQKKYMEDKPRYKESYAKAKRTYTKLKDVIPLLRGEYTDGYDVLEDLFDYFGVDSEDEIFEKSETQAALFRKQNNTSVNPINLCAWLRRGELDFKELDLPEYNEGNLMEWVKLREWQEHIEDSTYFLSLPEKFMSFGIGLILVPSLPNTVYGAIRWVDGRPLIQISDRGHDLMSCWFTLFHELGHAVRHKNIEIYEGCLNESKASQDKREREANKFANHYLFNGDDLRKNVFIRKRSGQNMSAISLAKEFGVLPILASYWLLKAQYQPTFQRRIPIDFVSEYQLA